MDTHTLFEQKKQRITEQWIKAVFDSYPLETTGFLRTKQDKFGNPVGEMTTTVANYLYDAAVGEHILAERVASALERFVKLRSVQDFLPSQGIGVLAMFKQFFRAELLPHFVQKKQVDAYLEAESRIDTLILMALDIYVKTRETLAEQRIKEIRDQHSQVVRWAQRHKIPNV